MKKKNKTNKESFGNIIPMWYPNTHVDHCEETCEESETQEEEAKINDIYIQSFIEEFQPEHNERLKYVRAISMGELRDILQIYRTYDSKTPDPLPFYLAVLANYGFKARIGFNGEQVILVSRRNNGRAIELE